MDLTAFRIVQEALTNVTKHAAADAAHVRLAYSGSRLLITVSDDGPAAAPDASAPGRGFGVMGMQHVTPDWSSARSRWRKRFVMHTGPVLPAFNASRYSPAGRPSAR